MFNIIIMDKYNKPDDIDADLAELEGLENEDPNDDLNNMDFNDVDIDLLEKEINAMGDEFTKTKNTTASKPSKKPLDVLEKEFHWVDCIFGNILDEEINNIIPNLKKRYAKDEYLDYQLLLSRKEQELLKYKDLIAKKVSEGTIDEKKYLEILNKMLKKNQELLKQATQNKLDEEHIKRISERLNGLQFEIDEVNEAINPTPMKENNTCFSSYIGMKKDNKKENEIKKEQNNSTIKTKQDMANKISNEGTKNNEAPKKEQQHVVLIYFAKKLSLFLKFQEYMQKYLSQDRPEDLKQLNLDITEMRNKLEEMKTNGCLETIEQLDKKYPDLSPEFVIGTSRKERNENIDKIFADVRKDVESLKDKQLVHVYNKHYIDLLRYLRDVKESIFGIIPKLNKKTVSIPYKEVNMNVPKNCMDISIENISPIKQGTQFSIQYEFIYDDKPYSDKTAYCSQNGTFNYKKRFILDKGKLSRSLARSNITFTLYKKKFFIGSKVVSKCTVPLNKLANFCTVNLKIEFPYKNATILSCPIVLMITMGLTKPMKELELYSVEKSYPIFKIGEANMVNDKKRMTVQPSTIKKEEANKNQDKQNKTDPSHYQTEPKQKNDINKESSVNSNLKDTRSNMRNASGFKYPILTAKQKKNLGVIISKNNIPNTYLDFQDKVLNITYLEEFKEEIEKQIDKYTQDEDMETVKDAQNMLVTATKLYNFLISKLQNGEMSPTEYKQKIETFIQVDEKYIAFFKNIKFENAVILITNRLAVMKNELEELNKQLNEQE